jgi:hypothetical protein
MRTCALGTIVLLVLAGCDFSHVKPQQTVVISGRALSATGAPLSHVQVHLYKEADLGEVIVGTVFSLGTLGAACLVPGAPSICRTGHLSTTNADGSYRFTLKGSDTQGMIGEASDLDVVFADPKGGAAAASTTLRFKAQSATVRLPAARLWSAGLRAAGRAAARPAYRVSWHGLPGRDGTDPGYTVQLLDPSRGLPLWSQPASGTAAQIDARVLEDHAAAAAVTARAALGNGTEATYLSARSPVRPLAGAAPSRHQPCLAVTGTTALATFRQTVCRATDGDFVSPSRLTATAGKVVTGVVLELVRPQAVSLVVARGLAGLVVVEVSADGHTYRQVATGDGPTLAVSPPGRPVARYVRIRSPSGLDESLLAEVSVW